MISRLILSRSEFEASHACGIVYKFPRSQFALSRLLEPSISCQPVNRRQLAHRDLNPSLHILNVLNRQLLDTDIPIAVHDAFMLSRVNYQIRAYAGGIPGLQYRNRIASINVIDN